jgi:hypothetical protein
MSIKTQANERNSILAAFVLSAVLFACLALTGCGGGEAEQPTDDGFVAETILPDLQPDTHTPDGPCKHPIACK